MSKFFYILLSLVLVFAFGACSGEKAENQEEMKAETTVEQQVDSTAEQAADTTMEATEEEEPND